MLRGGLLVSSNKEGLSRVLTVAFALCIVCSVVVSTAAVLLKPAQAVNKTRDLKRNILMAAGLYDPALTVEEQATARTAGGAVRRVDLGKAPSVPRCFRTNRPASLWTSST